MEKALLLHYKKNLQSELFTEIMSVIKRIIMDAITLCGEVRQPFEC
jgi:hypothetical protein